LCCGPFGGGGRRKPMPLKNPFFLYIAAFAAVLLTYQLDWSEVYPPLSSGLVLFFLATFFCAVILGLGIATIVNQIDTYEPGRLWKYTGAVLTLSFAADFVASGFVPLMSLVAGEHIDFDAIGITSLHLFNVTFGGSFATIRFADFLYSKRKIYLLQAFIPLVYFILLVYRAPALMCVVSWVFAYLIRHSGRVRLRPAIALATFAVLGLFLNGIMGDARSPSLIAESQIEELARPTEAFRQSGIPRTFFWSYAYFTSPMANLQTTFDVALPVVGKETLFVLGEMFPDAVTHRVLDYLGEERIRTPEISPGLNASTIFGASYVYLGQFGPPLMFAYLSLIVIVYLLLVRRSAFNVPSLALLNTIVVFCTFHNMIASSVLSLQLVWTVVLGWLVSRPPARRQAVGT
jgi:hypothetical protein